MKYAILDSNGVQVEWHNDSTITALPANAVELTDDQWNNRQPCSSDQLVANAKNKAINQVVSGRDNFRSQNVTVAGTTYIATDSAKTKLNNKLDLGSFPTQWSDINNVIVSLSKAQATAVLSAMIAQDDSAYLQASGYLIAINACTTVAQVQALTFTFS